MRRPPIWITGLLSGLVSLSVVGCTAPVTKPAGNENPDDPTAPVTFELKRPSLTNIAPTEVALGDEVKVFGRDFIDDKHGMLSLHYKGSFRNEAGQESRTEGDLPLTYISPGQAKFEFGPAIVFAQNGQDLGTFTGNFQVVSSLTSQAVNAEPGDMEISEEKSLAMKAGPSIYIEQLRSVDQPCDPVTRATIGESNLAIGVRALGMAAASEAAPITFSFTFPSPMLTAKYVRNEWYQQWPLVPTAYVDTQEGTNNTFSMVVKSGTSVAIDPQHYEQVVHVQPPVSIGQMQYNEVKLARLSTGAVDEPGSKNLQIIVQARKLDGQVISRTINFPVWNQIELQQWNGIEKLVQILPPEAEDLGCTAGGQLGADIQYSVGTSESRSRTVNMNWNINNALTLGLTVGYRFGTSANIGIGDIGVGINDEVHMDANTSATWSQTFGVDVSKTVTTEEHKNSTISVHIPPGYQIMSYRQASKLERKVGVVYHNACGVSGAVGEAVLTNWSFGFDLAQGPQCRPETKLTANVCGGGPTQPECDQQ